MVVRKAYIPALGTWFLGQTTDPFNPEEGGLTFDGRAPADMPTIAADDEKHQPVDVKAEPAPVFGDFLDCAALCNLASVFREHPTEERPVREKREEASAPWAATGDPTEMYVSHLRAFLETPVLTTGVHSAIQVFAHRFSHGRPTLQKAGHKQLAEHPFSSDLKRMAVIFSAPDGARTAYMKGAVERVLNVCGAVRQPDGDVPLTTDGREDIMRSVDAMAGQGLRVLALAARQWTGPNDAERDDVERDMCLLGLVGIYDPPRECQSYLLLCYMLTIAQVRSLVAPSKSASVRASSSTCLRVTILERQRPSRKRLVSSRLAMCAACRTVPLSLQSTLTR